MLAPLSISRAICCGRAAYLCYQSPLLNIMTKQNSKNNIHPAALQMRKADKLFIYHQLNKLGLSGRVCKRKPLGVLGKSGCCRWCWVGTGTSSGPSHAVPPLAEPMMPMGGGTWEGQLFLSRSLISCGAALVGHQLLVGISILWASASCVVFIRYPGLR